MLLGLAVFYLDSQPDLKVWHETALDEEFRAGGPVRSFADSLALENRLFAQLDRQVFARVPVQERSSINRFSEIEQILSEDPRQGIEALRGGESLPFTLSLLTSENEQVRRVPEFVKPAEPLH